MWTYTPDFIPNTIAIYGCGGTGSRVVPLVAQFIKTCKWVIDPEIHLFDFDTVEEKNLSRQNFVSKDVNKNKALVLAERYSRAFNINIIPHTSQVDPDYGEFKNCEDRSRFSTNCIHILCVDSPKARISILESIIDLLHSEIKYQPETNLIIDSGNENDFGQVKICSGHLYNYNYTLTNREKELLDLPNNLPIPVKLPALPLDLDYFYTMGETSAGSCADLDQTMAINVMMAVSIFGVIQNFYYAKPIAFHRLNVSLHHGVIPEYVDSSYFVNCGIMTQVDEKNESLGSPIPKLNYSNNKIIKKYFAFIPKFDLEVLAVAKKDYKLFLKNLEDPKSTDLGPESEIPAPKKKSSRKKTSVQLLPGLEYPVVVPEIDLIEPENIPF